MCNDLVFELAFALHKPPRQYLISVLYTRRLEAWWIFISEMNRDTVETFNFWTFQSTNSTDWQCKLWPSQINQEWKHLHDLFVNRQNPNKPTGVLWNPLLPRKRIIRWFSVVLQDRFCLRVASPSPGFGMTKYILVVGFWVRVWGQFLTSPIPNFSAFVRKRSYRTIGLSPPQRFGHGQGPPPLKAFLGEVVWESLRRVTVLLNCGIAPNDLCVL